MRQFYIDAIRRMTLKELALAYYNWRMEPDEFWDTITEARNV